jgi:cysteine desulfurase/selenocysteine lyase
MNATGTGGLAARVRGDFPILDQTVHDGKPLAYLDNAATTQKPTVVIRAIQEYYEQYNSNVHRALHVLGEKATAGYEGAREKTAAFVNAPSARSMVFTRGTTESINLVAFAWGRKFVCAGDEIITTVMEHHSNLIPWQQLAAATGALVKFVPVLDDGTLDVDAYHEMLSPKVKLVAVTHMSNILGTVNPVADMIAAAHRVGAKVLLDGAQSVPHLGVDVQALDCDFLAFSAHKMCGPTGMGGLFAREELLEAMDPFQSGGEMISKVTLESATWAEIPHKFEAGTPNIAGAIGLGAAIDYLNAIGMDEIRGQEEAITAYALERLAEISGLKVLGTASERGGVISFLMEDVHPHDVSQFVDGEGVAIRAGHGCAQPLLRRFGTHAVSRASFYVYTTEQEIDQLIDALVKVKAFFGHAI